MRDLRFNRLPVELLELVLSDIASAVMDAPVALGKFETSAFRGEKRVRRLNADGVEVIEKGTRKMEPGRDGGWGYSMKWTLAAKAPCGPVRLSFSASGWEPIPSDLGLRTEGVDPPTFRRIRARLRARLGNDADHSDDLWPALNNITTALAAGHRELAKELFDGAWTWPGASGDVLFAKLEALRPQLYDGDAQPGPRPPAPQQDPPPSPKPKPKPKPKAARKAQAPAPSSDAGDDYQIIDAYLRDRVRARARPCAVCADLAEGWLMVCNAPIVGDSQDGVEHPTLEPCAGVFDRIHPPSKEDWWRTNHVQRCSVCGLLYRYDYDYDSDMFYGGTSIAIRKVTRAEAAEFLIGRLRGDSQHACWDSSGARLLGPED